MEPFAWVDQHRLLHRQGPRMARGPVSCRTVWQAKDGGVAFRIVPGKQVKTVKTLLEWIIEEGEGEPLKAFDWDNLVLPNGQDDMKVIEQCVIDFVAKRTKKELFTEALKRHFDLVSSQNAADIVADDHLEARNYWSQIEQEDIGETFKYPGTRFISSEGRWATTKRAPHLGEHNAEVYGELGIDAEELKALKEGGAI